MIIFKKAVMMATIKNIKDELTKQQKENISDILDELENEKEIIDHIIDCINECESPKGENQIQTIFKAFDLFDINQTKILIIGQDPYSDSDKAHGLAFSVKKEGKNDDSLHNIFKAISDYNKKSFENWGTNLETWAKDNNVLLLNAALTHKNKDTIGKHIESWVPFINKIIKKLIKTENKLVVFLWGNKAQNCFFNAIKEISKTNPEECILNNKMILMTSHPSNRGKAVNQGFSEDAAKHFKACDDFLGKPTWLNFSP